MPRKKLIISGRLGDFSMSSFENADRVVSWITKRFSKWEKSGKPLELKPLAIGTRPNRDEERLLIEKNRWGTILGKWNALFPPTRKDRESLREDYQLVIREIRAWIEDKLTDQERVRMLATLRQHRFQKKHSKSLKIQTITIRLDRATYDSAMSGLSGIKKSEIISLLLQRFTNDQSLRSEILGQLS
jgi:hypothetical protein